MGELARIVVKLRRWSDASADRVLADCGAVDGGKRLRDIGVFRATVPEERADEVIARLSKHPDVELADREPQATSWAVTAYQATSTEGTFSSGDPVPLPHSWHESRHAIGRAKLKPLTDTTLRVGVTDTGVLENEDLPALPSGRRWHTAMDAGGTGNGATTTFSYAFPVTDPATVKCYVGGVLTPAAVTLGSNPKLGGTVTFASPPAAGATIRIQGDADRYDDLFLYCRGLQQLGSRYSHGTAVLGVVNALTGNGKGVSGIASEAPAVFVATAGNNGLFNGLDVAEALMVAAARTNEVVNGVAQGLGCCVVNCSWGEDRDNSSRYETDRAIWNPVFDYAAARDVVIVVSAGNDGLDLDAVPAPPCDHPAAFVVGGIQEDDGIAFWPRHQHGTWTGYSRYGARVDITAAASYVWSTGMSPADGLAAAQAGTGWNPSAYWNFGGTSCAAPVVAAAAWRVRATNPALTAEETKQILRDTADRSRNSTNYDQWFPGAGILNVAKAQAKAAALASPGTVHPHVQFFKPGPYTRLVADYANPTDGPWTYTAPGGTTTLSGPVDIDLGVFSTDPDATVELQVGGVTKYAGRAPWKIVGTATYDGTAAPVRLIGRDGTGAIVSDETFSDVYVTTLDVSVTVDPPPVGLYSGADAHASAAASVTVIQPLVASADGRAAASGQQSVGSPGSASGRATVSATLQTQPPISGSAGGHASAGGALSQIQQSAARVFALSTTDGSSLSFGMRSMRVSAVDGTSIGFGIAPTGYYGPAVELSGQATGHAGATALPGTFQHFVGTAGGHADGQGSTDAAGIAAGAAGQAGAAGSLSQEQRLAGEAAGAAGATATGPQFPIPLAGEAAGQAGAAGDANRVALRGSADGHTDVGADVTQVQPLAGVAEGQASARLTVAAPAIVIAIWDCSTRMVLADRSPVLDVADLSICMTLEDRSSP